MSNDTPFDFSTSLNGDLDFQWDSAGLNPSWLSFFVFSFAGGGGGAGKKNK